MDDEKSKSSPNWPLLAGIRMLMALIVFDNHLRLVGGSHVIEDLFRSGAAVSVFFVISGFSIAASLGRDAKGFFDRRFYRIWPLVLLATVVSVLPWVLNDGAFYAAGVYTEPPSPVKFLANLLCLQPLITGPPVLNAPMWSIGVEVAFYSLAPWFARLTSERRMLLIYGSMAAGLFCASRGYHLNLVTGVWPYLGLFWLWGLGFELFHRRNDKAFQVQMLLISLVAGNGTMLGGGWAGFTFAACMLLMFRQGEVHLPHRWKRFLVWMGELSFPLYVLHDPVMYLVNNYRPNSPQWLYYAACFAAAITTHHLYEAPIRALHRRFYSRSHNMQSRVAA